jgi:NAD(P)H-dependent flavin oxidoreductase YrpB (nitropropane dioxygenase family)
VSNAGGLGILTGLTQPTPEALRQAIRDTRKMTSKPFGVNLTFLPSISPPPYAEFAQVIIDEGIKVCETAGGPSASPIIQMLRKADIYVIHKCTSVRHANSAVKIGANMLSIDGFECAGHPGEDDIGGVVLVSILFYVIASNGPSLDKILNWDPLLSPFISNYSWLELLRSSKYHSSPLVVSPMAEGCVLFLWCSF